MTKKSILTDPEQNNNNWRRHKFQFEQSSVHVVLNECPFRKCCRQRDRIYIQPLVKNKIKIVKELLVLPLSHHQLSLKIKHNVKFQ